MKRYLKRVLVGFDQWVNTWFGGNEDETISSRSAKAAIKGKWWGRTLCKFLNWIDTGHCPGAIEYDEGERLPPMGG